MTMIDGMVENLALPVFAIICFGEDGWRHISMVFTSFWSTRSKMVQTDHRKVKGLILFVQKQPVP